MSITGHIYQISISAGGVPKLAVRHASIDAAGLAGDRHRDLVNHGGPDRAVCLYSLDYILALQAEGHPIYAGSAGENITLSGVPWERVVPGTRIRLGRQVLLEVTNYTTPCSNIVESFADGYINRIHQSRYPGWSRVYARVLQSGEVTVGDAAELA